MHKCQKCGKMIWFWQKWYTSYEFEEIIIIEGKTHTKCAVIKIQ